MKNTFCPNFSDLKVKLEFDELVDAVGENAAYYLWDLNNGYALDKAPNGAESKLFLDLLLHYNGNRDLSIRAKANVYSKAFKNWFGDWQQDDKTNVSKVVDENGEPLIVYHGTEYEFDVFSKELRGATDPGDWGLGFYFSPRKNVSEMYGSNIKPVYLSIKNPVPKEKFQMTDSFGREKAKSVTLREKIQEDIDVVEFSIKGYEEKLYGNDPEYKYYREEGSMYNKITKQLLERYKNKLRDLQTQLQEKSKEELDFDINKKWNDGVEEINKYDGIIPNINSKQLVKENHEIIVKDPNQIKSIDNRGTFSTIDNNIYNRKYDSNNRILFSLTETQQRSALNIDIDSGKISNSQDLIERLFMLNEENSLKNYANDEFPDIIYDRNVLNLLRLLYNVPANVNLRWSKPEDNKDVLATYNGDINIYAETIHNSSLESIAETVAHELLHHYLLKFLDNPKNSKYRKEFLEIKDKLVKYIPDEYKFYGLGDQSIDEFINEFMVNPVTRLIIYDAAKNIDSDTKNSHNDSKSVWLKFIEFIVDILRKINIIDSPKLKFDSSIKQLDDLYSTIEDLILQVNSKEIDTYESVDEFYNSRIDRESFNRELDGTRDVLQLLLELLNQSYQINTKEKIDEQLSKLRKSLSSSMEIKLNTLDIVDLDDKAEAEANIKYLISQLNDENVNDLYAIFQFTRLVNNDLPKIAQEILDAYNNLKVLSDDRILSLDRNFFGFYSPMMQEISDIIDDLSKFDTIKNTDVFQNLRDLTITVLNVLQLSRNHLRLMQTENFKRIMIESNIDSSNQIWLSTINEFVNGDVLNTNRDITQLTRLFMSPDKVKDPAMKTLYKLLQDSQNKRRQRVFNKSVIINKLSENIKGGLLQFYETDKNGKPTGYLIRNRKYGLFNNDVANFMQQLRIKFGMKPSDLNLPEDPILRALFAKLKNLFLSHRAERKYTTEFYEIMDSLSAEAQAARDLIDSKIRLLKDKYRDKSGYIDESKMNDEDRDKLQTLEIQKKLLKCRYYTDGTPKTGIDLQIAEDLQRVSKILGEDYITVKDTARFEKIRKQKQQELTEEEYNKWYESNTKLQYTEEFRKELEKLDKTRYGEEYIRLQNIRNEILAPYRDSRTNEILASKIPANTKYYLDRLERLMSNERKKYKGKKVDTSGLFKMVPTLEYFDLRDKAMLEAVVNGSFDEMIFETIFYMQTSHRTNAGWLPNSYYLKLVPADDKYIERVPNDNFNVLSPESKFYNKNFDHTSNEYYQPKAFATEDFIDENGKQIRKGDVLYDNSLQFKRVMLNKENRDFYNELVSTMKEANDYYYNRKFNNNYMLPLMEGSTYRYMKYKGLLKGFASKILSGFVKTNEDTQMKEKAVQSPDKLKLNLIPQYYTKRLEDPSIISADLIGIIMEYYDAAVNFDEKTKIKAKVETIKSVLGRRTYTKTSRFSKKKLEVEGVQTQIYKMADTFTDMQLYDRMNSLIKVELFSKEFNITKLVNTFRTIGTYVNLAGNWAVAATGGITGAYQMLVQTIVGRYYDWDDTRRALTFFVTDSFWSGIRNIGNRNYKSKLLALMDEAEIGSELRSRWQNSNHYGPLMTILRKLGFWGMSVVDYCVKGLILDAVMYNFKYVNGEFICKEDYLDKYGNTESTRHKWRSFESAMDCIEFKNGKLLTKDPLKQESWKKAKFKIYNTARALSASADGQLTTLQKALFTQNAFGGLAMMHRQYIPVVLSERYFMSYQYDPNLDRHREAVVSTIWRYIQKVYQDRNVYGLLNSAIRNYKEFNRDNATRASIKLGITELTLLLGVLPQITSFMLANADENDDSWWAKFLAYIAMRVEFESKSPYNLLDIINTIKNPTPLFGLIDNFKASLVSSTKQLFDFLGWTTSEDDNVVSRGAYKDWNKTLRNLFKLTPLKNPYEQYMDIDSKIRYYKTQIMNEDN